MRERPTGGHAERRTYADLLSAAHAAHFPEIRLLIHRLHLERIHRVLDAPCGDGFYSELLAEDLEPGGEVVAVDVDDKALAEVEQRARNMSRGATVTSLHADVFQMPLADESFDFAWCAQSLISLSNPGETSPGPGTLDVLQEFHRVLRPGGRIAVLEEDAMHYMILPWPAELELAIHHAERQGFARLYGRPEQLDAGRQLGKVLAKSGFEPLRKISLSADRQGIPHHDERAFLLAYFAELRKRIEQDISPDNLWEFDALTDARSRRSFFQDPEFEMTWLEFVILGSKA